MKFNVIHGDVFNYAVAGVNFNEGEIGPEKRIPVHCISADYVMGAGIAVPMASRYKLRSALRSYKVNAPACIFTNNVMNLITKDRVWQKPTLNNIRGALEECKRICEDYNIRWLVMPKIACGLDGWDWSTIRPLIESVFKNTDVDILVCAL